MFDLTALFGNGRVGKRAEQRFIERALQPLLEEAAGDQATADLERHRSLADRLAKLDADAEANGQRLAKAISKAREKETKLRDALVAAATERQNLQREAMGAGIVFDRERAALVRSLEELSPTQLESLVDDLERDLDTARHAGLAANSATRYEHAKSKVLRLADTVSTVRALRHQHLSDLDGRLADLRREADEILQEAPPPEPAFVSRF